VNTLLRGLIVALAGLVLAPVAGVLAPPNAVFSTPVSSSEVTQAVTVQPSTIVFARDELPVPEPPQTVTPRSPVYDSYLYVPTHAGQRQPLQVVIALHGMGGEGESFGARMIKDAERNGWLLVAPTIAYGDWHNPEVVAAEDIESARRLIATVDDLPLRTNLALKPRVDIYGFSRGAQLAHRFAIFFPERVDRVVAFSAGTYTLPYAVKAYPGDRNADSMPLPYGVSDLAPRLGRPLNPSGLRHVQFLIGVGAADNLSGDVPRQWDELLGKTRVERARQFVKALQTHGVSCSLQVYPAVGHEFTQTMLNEAMSFFTDQIIPYYPVSP
jgi:predicted esterase